MGLFRGRDINKKTTEDMYYLQEEISLEVCKCLYVRRDEFCSVDFKRLLGQRSYFFLSSIYSP